MRAGTSNERIREVYRELDEQAAGDLARENITVAPRIRRAIDMRYVGQNWELEVSLDGEPTDEALASAIRRFHGVHTERFGWALESGALEFVNCKLTVDVERPKASVPTLATGPVPEPISHRAVTFDPPDGTVEAAIYWRDDLHAENVIAGPAIIAETNCTVLLAPATRPARTPTAT